MYLIRLKTLLWRTLLTLTHTSIASISPWKLETTVTLSSTHWCGSAVDAAEVMKVSPLPFPQPACVLKIHVADDDSHFRFLPRHLVSQHQHCFVQFFKRVIFRFRFRLMGKMGFIFVSLLLIRRSMWYAFDYFLLLQIIWPLSCQLCHGWWIVAVDFILECCFYLVCFQGLRCWLIFFC